MRRVPGAVQLNMCGCTPQNLGVDSTSMDGPYTSTWKVVKDYIIPLASTNCLASVWKYPHIHLILDYSHVLPTWQYMAVE